MNTTHTWQEFNEMDNPNGEIRDFSEDFGDKVHLTNDADQIQQTVIRVVNNSLNTCIPSAKRIS